MREITVFGKLIRLRTGYVLLFFWVLSVLAYFLTFKGGFYDDFLDGFLPIYHKSSFEDFVLNPSTSLYWGVNLVHFIFISVFGQHTLIWGLCFTFLHAVNAVMVFKVLLGFFEQMKITEATKISFLSSVLFLFSPMAAEVVVWRACSHYLISLFLLLSIINWLITFTKTEDNKYAWYIGITYYLSTFFLEYFYLTPIYVFIVLLIFLWGGVISFKQWKTAQVKIFLPIVILFIIYLITLKLWLGRMVGRVDGGPLASLHPAHMIEWISRISLRITAFEYLYPNEIRQKIKSVLSSRFFLISFGLLISSFLFWGCWAFKRKGSVFKTTFLLVLLTLASYIIVFPMWLYDEFLYVGSRYFYHIVVFASALFTLLVFKLIKSKRIALGLWFVCLISNVGALMFINKNVYYAAKIQWALIDNFKWSDKKNILILNAPTKINGITIMPAAREVGYLKTSLAYLKGQPLKANVYEVAGYNLVNRYDACHVKVENDSTLTVTLNQFGTWWWMGHFGAYDYTNDFFDFELINDAFSYRLKFHRPVDTNTVILMQQGGVWKEIDMTMRNAEQW